MVHFARNRPYNHSWIARCACARSLKQKRTNKHDAGCMGQVRTAASVPWGRWYLCASTHQSAAGQTQKMVPLCSQIWRQVCIHIQTKYYALEIAASCTLRVVIKRAWARNFGAACKNFKFWPVWSWKFWDLRFKFPFFVVASLFTTLAPDLQFSSNYCF